MQLHNIILGQMYSLIIYTSKTVLIQNPNDQTTTTWMTVHFVSVFIFLNGQTKVSIQLLLHRITISPLCVIRYANNDRR